MLEITNLMFTYGEEQLFNKATVRINNGERVGLIGLNGVGKSTLMNIIAGRLSQDSGSVIWDNGISFSYLDQHLTVNTLDSVSSYLYSVYDELFKKEKEMNALYESLADANENEFDKILRKAENVQSYLDEKNFYMIKSKIGNIINGLGIDIENTRPLKDLSGGQRAKVFLGKMLLEEKDVLLLDEPTNFLDLKHIEWLSKFLASYEKGFIVISHNVEFLNSVCQVIVELENKVLTKYKGNFDAYIAQKDQNAIAYLKAYQRQQAFIKHNEEFINKNIVRATTTKRAQSRRKLLEHLDVMAPPTKEEPVYYSFKFTKSFHLNPLVTKDLAIGYDHIILDKINLKFEFGKKYVIVGKNGIGKTTFVKTILSILKPLGGSFNLSELNTISYFAQEEDVNDITPIEYFREKYPLMENGDIRKVLAKYAIKGDLALKSMKQLSGGEQAKVRFARLSLEKSNLLILDEPTNHLDKLAKESLFNELASYPGTIILVSHEKEFYKKLKMIEIRFE